MPVDGEAAGVPDAGLEVRALAQGAPAKMVAGDAALLDEVAATGRATLRWWEATTAAVVLGFAQHARRAALVDDERCRQAGVAVVERHAGGGVVWLDAHMLCFAVALPTGHTLLKCDVTAAYQWLGERLAAGLRALGLAARRVEVAEARAQVAALAADPDPATHLLRAACFAALSPHEVVIGEAKVVGLAQVRRKAATLFVGGVLLRNQASLAECVAMPDEASRARLRADLARWTVGLDEVLAPTLPVRELATHLTPYLLGATS